MRNLAYDGSALFSVLCMLAVVPAVPEVSLDTIFGVQAAEAELMDSSNFTLTIEGQLFGESSTEKSRQVFNVERASRNVFCQYEWYSSVTRIAFEDAQSSSGDEISNVFPIPSVATGRALVLTDYALVWADLTMPQLQIYYPDDWEQYGVTEKLERHLQIHVPPSPSDIAFGGGVHEGTLEEYRSQLERSLAGTPAAGKLQWIVDDADIVGGAVHVTGLLNGKIYMRITLDPSKGYRTVKAEAGFNDNGTARESWTKSYQNVQGIWFPQSLVHSVLSEDGELRERRTWTLSEVSMAGTLSDGDDSEWLDRVELPERALVRRVFPSESQNPPHDLEYLNGELREIRDLNELVFTLSLAN